MSGNKELQNEAKLHAEAVQIIADALREFATPYRFQRSSSGAARAIIAWLADAGIVLERYEDKPSKTETPQQYMERVKDIDTLGW